MKTVFLGRIVLLAAIVGLAISAAAAVTRPRPWALQCESSHQTPDVQQPSHYEFDITNQAPKGTGL